MRIVIRDGGTMKAMGPMNAGKWVHEPRERKYEAVADIENDFDRSHIEWMLENEQKQSTLGQRHYEIDEE